MSRLSKRSNNLSNGLTSSEPVVVLSSSDLNTKHKHKSSRSSQLTESTKSTGSQSRYSGFQVGSGYKILLESDNAKLFIDEVKHLQKVAEQKQSIKIDNANEYKKAATQIEGVLTILSNDISPEKRKLEVLKKDLEKLSENDKFYVFKTPIRCKVIVGGKEEEGFVIAMDDGVVAVAKTEKGTYMVTFENQLEILHQQQGGKDNKGSKSNKNDRSNKEFDKVSKSENKSSTRSTEKSTEKSIFIPSSRDNDLDQTDTGSESQNVGTSNKSTSTRRSEKTESSSAKISSPRTESSLTTSSRKKSSSSPYVATSEYDIPTRSKESSEKSREVFSSASTDSEATVSTTTSDPETETVDESSNKSEYLKKIKHDMKGGAKDVKNKNHEIHKKEDRKNKGLKFMKAGKADSIGIIESTKGYYSESTSIEDGLCE